MQGLDFEEGDKVRFVRNDQSVQDFGKAAGKLSDLALGKIYVIKDICIYKWHSCLRLDGIDGTFNDRLFEIAEGE